MTTEKISTESMTELGRERAMGARGTVSDHRSVPVIDLTDREARRAEITDELWEAAIGIGFFQLSGHGIDQEIVDKAFAYSQAFFAQDDAVKARRAQPRGVNAGWESLTQVRPSVGTPDSKESYQITGPKMDGLWVADDEVAGFREFYEDFMERCREVAMWVLSCFAERLDLGRDFFTALHDPTNPQHQSTLRLLHYYPVDPAQLDGSGWRAGAHTDFDCLTLLFQRAGQGGLQVCPGSEAGEAVWTPVVPADDVITCNIGDMLMRWSDDRLASNFHRVVSPTEGDDLGDRYSIAYFAQADADAVITSPTGLYPELTAGEYIAQRVAANYRPGTA